MKVGSNFVRIALALSTMACLGNACDGTSSSKPPQTPGNFITFSQHRYPKFYTGDILRPNDCLRNPDVPVVDQRAAGAGWSRIEHLEDDPGCSWTTGAVRANQFRDGVAQNADFIWFSGHGDNGVNSLFNYSPQQAINAGGFDCNQGDPDGTCFWGQTAGLPTAGRLKWIMAFASDNANNSSWRYLFNPGTPGIHGYFGISGEPDGNVGDVLANRFFNDAIGAGRLAIRDAWMNAVWNTTGQSYGIWELADAKKDALSASGSSSSGVTSATNPLTYTDTSGTYVVPRSLQSLNDVSPGTYSPLALTTESYSDASLAARSDAYSPGSSKYYQDSNTYVISGADYVADHYEASQGIIVSASHSLYAYNYAQADSQSFAESFMSGQGVPLPADAQLQSARAVYTTPYGGTPVLMGYVFTYGHSNGMTGGDAIRISVDNYVQRVCLQPNPNDPPYNKPACLQWGYDYPQHVNSFYRLWRQTSGSLRYPLGSHGTGSAALSPNQAFSIASTSSQIKGVHLATLQGYVYGYWTPPINSTDNTAYPAYHYFFSNHAVVSADAYSGQILGVLGSLN